MLSWRFLFFVAVVLFVQRSADTVSAQTEGDAQGPVQVIFGSLDAGQMIEYRVPFLNAGDVLFVYGDGVSGNLDVFLGVVNPDVTSSDLEAEIASAIQAAPSGTDHVMAVETALEAAYLTSDDDSGSGYDAALSFRVPLDGDYALVVRSSYTRSTFGGYRLLVGINEPNVMTGEAEPTGDMLAFLDRDNQQIREAVDKISGTLSSQTGFEVFRLKGIAAGDSLYVFLVVLEGDLRPLVMLQDFVGKSIRASSPIGESNAVAFEYTFPEDAEDYQLILSPGRAGESDVANYQLLIGVNAPDVLTGSAHPTERRVIRLPTEVSIWLDLDQVSAVDQRNENFTVVASLHMRWNDPARAFRPDDCGCPFKTYLGDDFSEFTRSDQGLIWPEYVIFNQQGERLTQSRGAVVSSDGTVTFLERLTVVLQAPDFDFRLFPLDSQVFYFRVDMLFGDDRYVFAPTEGQFPPGDQLGQEEYVFRSPEVSAHSENGVSRFTLRLEAKRNLTFYVLRVLLPIVLVLAVTWITFFLGDIVKRIDVAGANLLVFVAFNLSVSDDLPRLGYLTLLDSVLVSTFVVTSLIIVLNVYLRWLWDHDRELRAKQIDRMAIWVYPLGFLAVTTFMILCFVVPTG